MVNKKTLKTTVYTLLSLVFWIAVWYWAALKINSSVVLPSPKETFKQIIFIVSNSDFLLICVNSVFKIFLGALFGVVIGILTALCAFFLPPIKYLISPVLSIIKATPIASFIVLLLIVLGKAPVPSITSALISMPILFSNVYTALENVDKKLLEVCEVYSIGFKKRLHYLWIPSIFPHIVSGIKSGIGLSWKAGIAAEVLCAPENSIGLKIHESRIYLETPCLFAWTAIVIVLSICFERLSVLLLKERRRK